jgi:hypothetical protein
MKTIGALFCRCPNSEHRHREWLGGGGGRLLRELPLHGKPQQPHPGQMVGV